MRSSASYFHCFARIFLHPLQPASAAPRGWGCLDEAGARQTRTSGMGLRLAAGPTIGADRLLTGGVHSTCMVRSVPLCGPNVWICWGRPRGQLPGPGNMMVQTFLYAGGL